MIILIPSPASRAAVAVTVGTAGPAFTPRRGSPVEDPTRVGDEPISPPCCTPLTELDHPVLPIAA